MPNSTYVIEDQERMARAMNYIAWQSRLIAPELGRRVVEVGSGVGNFTGTLLDRELVIATDVELDCLERLVRRYPNRPNLIALPYGVEDPEFSTLAKWRPDSCVCINVLEHINDDVGALQRMWSVLDPGGVIVLFVPAFPALYGPTDRMMGHYRRYTRKTLASVAHAASLRIRKMHHVNAIGFFGWWANARVFRHGDLSVRQIDAFDRYVAPVMSRVEAAVAPPFGQSLFAVLERS